MKEVSKRQIRQAKRWFEENMRRAAVVERRRRATLKTKEEIDEERRKAKNKLRNFRKKVARN